VGDQGVGCVVNKEVPPNDIGKRGRKRGKPSNDLGKGVGAQRAFKCC
jgi:hypothetical protein